MIHQMIHVSYIAPISIYGLDSINPKHPQFQINVMWCVFSMHYAHHWTLYYANLNRCTKKNLSYMIHSKHTKLSL